MRGARVLRFTSARFTSDRDFNLILKIVYLRSNSRSKKRQKCILLQYMYWNYNAKTHTCIFCFVYCIVFFGSPERNFKKYKRPRIQYNTFVLYCICILVLLLIDCCCGSDSEPQQQSINRRPNRGWVQMRWKGAKFRWG